MAAREPYKYLVLLDTIFSAPAALGICITFSASSGALGLWEALLVLHITHKLL